MHSFSFFIVYFCLTLVLKEFAIYSHPCFVLVGTHTCFTTRDMTDMSR